MEERRRGVTETGLARILPVLNPQPPYDEKALNNLPASPLDGRAARRRRPTLPMTPNPDSTTDQQQRLAHLLGQLDDLAEELAGDPQGLLSLLRQLEQRHRSIQDGPFRSSLPADRNRLFSLLQEMERSGGWPYIPRLQLRTFMDLLQRDDATDGLPQQPEHPLAA
jgi:hypothetical protein